jgi:hypothetical protein
MVTGIKFVPPQFDIIDIGPTKRLTGCQVYWQSGGAAGYVLFALYEFEKILLFNIKYAKINPVMIIIWMKIVITERIVKSG